MLQLSTGFIGIDLPADLRDIHYDVTHFEVTGEWWGTFGLNCMALIPGIGLVKDMNRGLKGISAGSEEINSIIKVTEVSGNAGITEIQRAKWKEYAGTDPIGEVHHGLSEQYHDWFKEHGIEDINSGEFYFDLDKGTHRLKIDNGIHTNNSPLGNNWNGVWRKWMQQNPEAGPQDIINQLNSMAEKAGIEQYRAKVK